MKYYNNKINILLVSILVVGVYHACSHCEDSLVLNLFWTGMLLLQGNLRRLSSKKTAVHFLRMSLYFIPYLLPTILKGDTKWLSPKTIVYLMVALLIYVLWVAIKFDKIKIFLSDEMISQSQREKRVTLFMYIYNLIGASISEELFFRSYILSMQGDCFFLLIMSTSLFWTSHWISPWDKKITLGDSIQQIYVGVGCSLLYIFSNSILPSLLLHLLFNAIPGVYYLKKYDRFYRNKEKYDRIQARILKDDLYL